MKEIERRIYVDDEIFYNEYSYMYGDKKDVEVSFSYYHVKKDKETCCYAGRNYADCLAFARYRANDGRYRNFEFLIRS
jgi:hypothetical protein